VSGNGKNAQEKRMVVVCKVDPNNKLIKIVVDNREQFIFNQDLKCATYPAPKHFSIGA
jgi:hypothetical protein